MTILPVTCPYCNALVTVPPGTSGGQRVPCPRCGESFALLTAQPPASTDLTREPSNVPMLETEPRLRGQPWLVQKPFQANRRTALIILAVMALMAAGGLTLALATQAQRRKNDSGILDQTSPKRRPPIDVVTSNDATPTPPAKLAALAWAPPKTTVLVGIHVRELRASAAGKALLTQPMAIGGTPIQVEAIAEWTGIALDEIDHLVVADNAEKKVPVPILLVHTRGDINHQELWDRLKARRAGRAGERIVYEFENKRPGVPPLLSPLVVCALDERTLAYALVAQQFNDLATKPQADLGQLPGEVEEALKKRIGPIGPLWTVGYSDDWGKTSVPALFKLDKMKQEDRNRLLKVSTFAAWLQPNDPLLVRADFDCGNEETAKGLQKYLDIPDVGVDPNWSAAREDRWLSVQIRTSAKDVGKFLQR